MKTLEPIKIIVQRSKDEKIELTLNCDSNIEDWEYTFKTILKWLGFADETIKETFYEES